MRDELPKTPNVRECGVINLGDSSTIGSHWTAYYKNKYEKYYFDSYGDAKPPKELIEYLGGKNLYYNSDRIQNHDDPPICGHLCLVVLNLLSQKVPYTTIIERLKKK
jgi:hypothetical protein